MALKTKKAAVPTDRCLRSGNVAAAVSSSSSSSSIPPSLSSPSSSPFLSSLLISSPIPSPPLLHPPSSSSSIIVPKRARGRNAAMIARSDSPIANANAPNPISIVHNNKPLLRHLPTVRVAPPPKISRSKIPRDIGIKQSQFIDPSLITSSLATPPHRPIVAYSPSPLPASSSSSSSPSSPSSSSSPSPSVSSSPSPIIVDHHLASIARLCTIRDIMSRSLASIDIECPALRVDDLSSFVDDLAATMIMITTTIINDRHTIESQRASAVMIASEHAEVSHNNAADAAAASIAAASAHRAQIDIVRDTLSAPLASMRESYSILRSSVVNDMSSLNREYTSSLTLIGQRAQSINAELQSAKRELQRTNQSLQDAKCELQNTSTMLATAQANRLQDAVDAQSVSDAKDRAHERVMQNQLSSELANRANYAAEALLINEANNRVLQQSLQHTLALLSSEQIKRKKLHNEYMQIQGNIRVFVRVRPINKEELDLGDDGRTIDYPTENSLILHTSSSSSSSDKPFEFDRVFSPASTQEDVYKAVSPFVQSAIDGFNICVFAYGQTGAGKSYTMDGPMHDRGVNHRVLDELFSIIGAPRRDDDTAATSVFTYEIFVSAVEVYNESLRDLLLVPIVSSSRHASTRSTSNGAKSLDIRQIDGLTVVPDLSETRVASSAEVTHLINTRATPNRAVCSTNMNATSSRSHSVIIIRIVGSNTNGGKSIGKITLVDLAGSERVARSGSEGQSLVEANDINTSLLALGNVISALQTKQPHIPYRASKLTHLLKDSLGGQSAKVIMLCQISPANTSKAESTSSLQFALRAAQTALGAAKKTKTNGNAPAIASLAPTASSSVSSYTPTPSAITAGTTTAAPASRSESMFATFNKLSDDLKKRRRDKVNESKTIVAPRPSTRSHQITLGATANASFVTIGHNGDANINDENRLTDNSVDTDDQFNNRQSCSTDFTRDDYCSITNTIIAEASASSSSVIPASHSANISVASSSLVPSTTRARMRQRATTAAAAAAVTTTISNSAQIATMRQSSSVPISSRNSTRMRQ